MDGYYEDVFEAAPCALLVVDQDLRIVDFNRSAFALFGEQGDPINSLLGHALRCENALASSGGCGTSEECPECRFRTDAGECLRTGRATRSIVSKRMITERGVAVDTLMVQSAAAHTSKRPGTGTNLVLAIQRLSDWDEALKKASYAPRT